MYETVVSVWCCFLTAGVVSFGRVIVYLLWVDFSLGFLWSLMPVKRSRAENAWTFTTEAPQRRLSWKNSIAMAHQLLVCAFLQRSQDDHFHSRHIPPPTPPPWLCVWQLVTFSRLLIQQHWPTLYPHPPTLQPPQSPTRLPSLGLSTLFHYVCKNLQHLRSQDDRG